LRDDPVASIDQLRRLRQLRRGRRCRHPVPVSFYRADVVHNRASWKPGWALARGLAQLSAGQAPRRAPLDLGAMTVHERRTKPLPPASGRHHQAGVLAVGGQGGGVLTGWIEGLARANGYVAQATSVAGVAQRTGATVYYVEMAPAARKSRSFR
jgi:hypothetical protein